MGTASDDTHTSGDAVPEKSNIRDGEKTISPKGPSQHHRVAEFDVGQDQGIYRRKWYQLWLPRNPPPPHPASLDDAPVIPLASANILSKLTYHWITPIITLGYQRPLQVTDLWKMDHSREAGTMSSKFDEVWTKRVLNAQEWNQKLDSGELKPGLVRRSWWHVGSVIGKGAYAAREQRWRSVDGRKQASIAWSLNEVLGFAFWTGGIFKVVGDTAQLMIPLLSKALINFGKDRATRKADGEAPPSIGRGLGLAIGMFVLTITTSVCSHQFFWRSMNTGVLARAALISSLYKRGMRLTPKAHAKHTNAKLINHMSTDISRIDYCAQWFHGIWTALLQVLICLGLLIAQLGPSALAGFAVFILLIPVQSALMKQQLKVRGQSMRWTDERAGLLQELLSAMRIIKYFCYEVPFLERINRVRRDELRGVRDIQYIKALGMAIAFSVPTLASVLAFVSYALAGHSLDPAVIFTSLSLFGLLRQPLMFFPRAVGSFTDAQNAVQRLTPVWHAETLDETKQVDPSSEWAITVSDADFQWEETIAVAAPNEKKGKRDRTKPADKKPKAEPQAVEPQADPFALRHVSLSIPRGQLCAIAGPVGSGKSSLLQALIGEMKQIRGPKPIFGGRVGYCSQIAWIQNASLRDNVLFGAEFVEEKYWNAVQDASLLSDLEMLPDGDLTEIGEKGINLSGGQKQRVNIARALYNDADIVILDDPLSAVDAHVGEALFANAIMGALKNRGKTVILVTHALHFLDKVDYIYNVVDGIIVEQGTFEQLVKNGEAFSKLLQDFVDKEVQDDPEATTDLQLTRAKDEQKAIEQKEVALNDVKQKLDMKLVDKATGRGRLEGRLIKAEKRTTGSINVDVYSTYCKAGRGLLVIPWIILTCVLMQGAMVVSSYCTFHQSQGWYMGFYAALSIGQAFFTFAIGWTLAILACNACANLHHLAVDKIFHAPMSFFDTTPLGRILGVFGKDVDTLDNLLADAIRMFLLTMATAIGSIIIITILLHYFVAVVAVLLVGYWYFAEYYRVSARELKRLDGSLRSLLYSHFAESLTGMPTIRAYGNVRQFVQENDYFIDLENRALFLTCTNQRWLAIRLDFMGALLVFSVAIMAAAGVNGISPAQIGLVLVYCSSLTQAFGVVTRQSAEVENNMNAVERTVHYTRDDLIEQEPPHEIAATKPAGEWPTGGSLEFRDVVMSYRKGLPPVLKGIDLEIKPGERIGVVGRTGAGKSSLMIALYRIVELSTGSIWLDGIDISTIGLRDLRSKISIIPQDPLLFSGTIRSNLDPFSLYDDANLYDALRRAHLIDRSPTTGTTTPVEPSTQQATTSGSSRFNLDTPVDPEGANLSVGERSLLSLARALVREDIKLVVMDEATASVDIETDNAIQETISREFKGKTLLCIAHRLRTIIRYDRVLVLDAGKIAEFDTPLNLFQRDEGIFRSLCEQSKINEDDIRFEH